MTLGELPPPLGQDVVRQARYLEDQRVVSDTLFEEQRQKSFSMGHPQQFRFGRIRTVTDSMATQ